MEEIYSEKVEEEIYSEKVEEEEICREVQVGLGTKVELLTSVKPIE